MHHIDYRLDVLNGSVLQDAMTQIEDMTRTTAGSAQDVVDSLLDFRNRREEQRGIKVALHGHIAPYNVPAIVKRDAPVEADHVSPGAFHQRKKSCGVRSKMDHGHILGSGGSQNSL